MILNTHIIGIHDAVIPTIDNQLLSMKLELIIDICKINFIN